MALDHDEKFFPTDPATGHKVCTLNCEEDPESVLYRYGIFGDTSFLDKLPKLSAQQYNKVIRRLNAKIAEIIREVNKSHRSKRTKNNANPKSRP